MRQRDVTDIVGGAVMIVFGLAVAWYSDRYTMGTLMRMGPGYFPTVLGYLLAFLGALIVLPALRRQEAAHPIHWRPLLAILGAVAVFGLTVAHIGLVPATFLLVGIAAFAQHEVRILRTLVLAAALAALAVLVFTKGLGLLLPTFRWPF